MNYIFMLGLTRLSGLLYYLYVTFLGLPTRPMFGSVADKELAMRKRKASLFPSPEGPALPVLPAHCGFLYDRTADPLPPTSASRAIRNTVLGAGGPMLAL
jgi:hypothetical protein